MRRLVLGIFTAVVLLVLFVLLFTFVRYPYEIVLLDRFGTLIPENQQAKIAYNWYFKLPSDNVVRIDRRLHLFPGTLQQVVTQTSAPISVQTFAAWRIVEPIKFYNKTSGSDQAAQKLIDDRIRALVGDKFGKHTLDELFNTDTTKVHSGDIEKEIANEATNGTPGGQPGLKDVGLEIAQVGFSRMAFPPNTTDAVYYRMVVDLNTKARKLEAEGTRDATTIRAEGEAQASIIRNQATSEAKTIMGEADAQANAILQDVQKTAAAREFYQYWKSLDFTKSSLAKNTILVLSSDSPLLSSLFRKPAEGGPATQPANSSIKPPDPATIVPSTPER